VDGQEPGGKVGTFAEAARFGDLVVLAVKGTVAGEALRAAGAAHIAGKCVIDTTNPSPMRRQTRACCASSRPSMIL